MKVTLLAHTELDSVLAADSLIRQGVGTLQENVIEYAGRVCYRSDARMGKQPTFIALRVREGHEDIIEHVRLVFRIEGVPLDGDLMLLANQPTVEYTDLGNGRWIFSMNARNARDYRRVCDSALAAELVRLAYDVLPSVYQDYANDRGVA
ncbi:MAG: hypothetical protein GY759_15900 [Chloroflexi bacterium]|nr:hypothetical protein [Chloroflexota bacterium]